MTLTVFVGCFSLASCGPKQPEQPERNDLTAHLEELTIVTREPLVIEVDFVLSNRGSEPLSIAERWNSWGAYQWSFKLTDAEGTIVECQNMQRFWTRNFFTIVTIEPGNEHRMNCLLTLSRLRKYRADIDYYLPSKEIAGVVFPATLVGTFSVPENQSEGDLATNWEGKVSTNPIQLTKTEQEIAPDR